MTRSHLNFRLSFAGILALAAGAAFLAACAEGEATDGKKRKRTGVPDDYYSEPIEKDPPIEGTVNPDSGAFGAGSRPSNKDGGADDGGDGPKVYCGGALQAGDSRSSSSW